MFRFVIAIILVIPTTILSNRYSGRTENPDYNWHNYGDMVSVS